MRRLFFKIVYAALGIALLSYGFNKGMELDKLITVFLGGALIGLAVRK
jgi:hypothetical protein